MRLVLVILLDAGVQQVQVAQLAVGGVTTVIIIRVAACQITDDSQVDVVQRPADGQRVVLRVVAVQVSRLVAGDDTRVAPLDAETEFVSQCTGLGEFDGLLGVVLVNAHDVVGVCGPSLLVGVHLGGRHIYLQ